MAGEPFQLDVGLYIHVPFCATKCGYCDFYSTVPHAGAFEPLVDALLCELAQRLEPCMRVETIFVGGGTPTLLPLSPLRNLMQALARIAVDHRPVEFTVEANPASLNDAKAGLLRECGVTRISMGAQSFHAHELRALDRIHKPEDIATSAAVIHRAGFAHFNLDLIFGIPGQTPASWDESVRRAIALGPDHLACYGLTYEPDTPLREKLDAGLIRPVEEEFEADLYTTTMSRLEGAGFAQYEISNYAKPGAQSRHNIRYWLNLPGIGIGPSAATYLHGRRWRNVPDTAQYVRRLAVGTPTAIDEEELGPLERAGETAMLQLRLVEGIGRERFSRATGYDPVELFAEVIERHVKSGLLSVTSSHIALTRRGRLLGDLVVADFLSPKTSCA